MKTDAQLKDDVTEELRMVRHVRGVTGLLNNITVRPPANPAQVQTLIEEMLKRQAEAGALQIRVEVSGQRAEPSGDRPIILAGADRRQRHHEGRNRDERPYRYRLPERGHGPARLRRAHETGKRPGGRPGGCGHHQA
jgi:hypothetical protein